MTESTLTTPTVELDVTPHANAVGGQSFSIDNPVHRLRVMAASSFFGEPEYYKDGAKDRSVNSTKAKQASLMDHLIDVLKGVIPLKFTAGKTTAQAMEDVIDEALSHDFDATLALAIELRTVEHIRTTPQVILVRAANHPSAVGNGNFRVAARSIILRADEPAVQAAYQLGIYGKKIPTRLKRAWADALESFTEYQLAKYQMKNRVVKTVDVVRLCHASSKANPAIEKLIYDKLSLTDNRTWEKVISTEGSNKDTWEKVIDELWVEVE